MIHWVENRTVPVHVHRGLILSEVVSGEFHFADEFSGLRQRLQAGDLMLSEPGAVVSGQVNGRFRSLVIPVDDWSKTSRRATYRLDDNSWHSLFEAGLGDTQARQQILERWRQSRPATLPQSDQEVTLSRVRLTLERELGGPVPLNRLADDAGWHPHHLQRLFRRRYGLSPAQYHRQLRVEAAQARLMAGEEVGALAADLGFADQSHFTRVYRSYYGVSPAASTRKFYPALLTIS